MADCTVVNIRTSPCDVYIGRARSAETGLFGNPFVVTVHGRARALELFKEYFLARLGDDTAFREAVIGLAGKRLGCFCKPESCHGDIIAEWVNSHG